MFTQKYMLLLNVKCKKLIQFKINVNLKKISPWNYRQRLIVIKLFGVEYKCAL